MKFYTEIDSDGWSTICVKKRTSGKDRKLERFIKGWQLAAENIRKLCAMCE